MPHDRRKRKSLTIHSALRPPAPDQKHTIKTQHLLSLTSVFFPHTDPSEFMESHLVKRNFLPQNWLSNMMLMQTEEKESFNFKGISYFYFFRLDISITTEIFFLRTKVMFNYLGVTGIVLVPDLCFRCSREETVSW